MKKNLAYGLLVFMCAAALIIYESSNVLAQSSCTSPPSNNQYWAPGSKINVYIDPSFSPDQQTAIKAAVNDWAGQTALTGNSITLTTTTTDPGASASNSIRIMNNPAGSPNNLAFTSTTTTTQSGNQTSSATISFNGGFTLSDGSKAYDPNGPTAGTFLEHIFDHELGHVFGENDMPVPTDPSTGQPNACLETPGASTMNGYCGTNDTGPPSVSSGITPCDNSVVNQDITTQGGTSGGGGGGGFVRCPPGFRPNQDGGCNPSPIIIDVDGSGFKLTDAAHGVRFDMFDDGHPVQVAWTAPESTNAFLVLDRNNNGIIDNSTELFGNFTPQPDSPAPNGFAALAEFDKPENGGNGDVIIDARDAVFSRLRLWQDSNHDGTSQPEELHGLEELGVQWISLDYRRSERVDEFGNRFRFRAKVDNAAHSHGSRWAWDVFFVWQNP